MKKHPVFDLWLHDDEELETIAGAGICERKTLREWPLSFVEHVILQDGTSRIYKSQHGSPVEPAFYRKANSKHIPAIYYNHSYEDDHWMLLEDIDGKHPSALDREGLLSLGLNVRGITSALGNMEPYRYDLSEKGYEFFANSTVELLNVLHAGGKLKMTEVSVILRIKEALTHPEVLRTVGGRCVLLHGDLKYDNILIRPNGEVVLIDWQSVLFGPECLDIYSLMATQAMDPVPIAGIGPEILRMGLEMRWFADCLNTWMPNAVFLDGWISNIEMHMRHVIENSGYNGIAVYYFH
jgi:serine/threonine protein kinase